MSFYTDKNIITLNNGNYNSKREVQFEQNLDYQKHYYNLEEKKEITRLKSDFKNQNSVFLIRKKETIPEYIKTEINSFKNKKHLKMHSFKTIIVRLLFQQLSSRHFLFGERNL